MRTEKELNSITSTIPNGVRGQKSPVKIDPAARGVMLSERPLVALEEQTMTDTTHVRAKSD